MQRAETAGLWFWEKIDLLCLPPCVSAAIRERSNDTAAPMTAGTEGESPSALFCSYQKLLWGHCRHLWIYLGRRKWKGVSCSSRKVVLGSKQLGGRKRRCGEGQKNALRIRGGRHLGLWDKWCGTRLVCDSSLYSTDSEEKTAGKWRTENGANAPSSPCYLSNIHGKSKGETGSTHPPTHAWPNIAGSSSCHKQCILQGHPFPLFIILPFG